VAANFASEIGVFFDGKPMSDAQYERTAKTVVELIVNGLRPAGTGVISV
jgi:hypothetical protein